MLSGCGRIATRWSRCAYVGVAPLHAFGYRSCTTATTKTKREDLRNIAVIAHVDHGKTTLVDGLLKQSGTLAGAHGRVMDSGAQEKERGITILAKNTGITLKDFGPGVKGPADAMRINIVDTPGHLDFSGEVERALQMVEGFILLVDAAESVKPGTRYVLRKALSLDLRPIVVINKIDKDDSNIEKVVSDIQDLFLDIAVKDEQLNHIYFMYGSGRAGYVNSTPLKDGTLFPLFQQIFDKIPAPSQPNPDSPLRMLVSSLDEETTVPGSTRPEDVQKVAIGRIFAGVVKKDQVVTVTLAGKQCNALVKSIRIFQGVDRVSVPSAKFGDIVMLALQEPLDGRKVPLEIGATICEDGKVDPWPYKPPDEPTFSLVVKAIEASWKDKEVSPTVQRLRRWDETTARFRREALVNTALRVETLEGSAVKLHGRGPLHLSVILEEMRREGYSFEVFAPKVLTKVIDGVLCEPYEKVTLEFKGTVSDRVISSLSQRMCEMGDFKSIAGGRSQLDITLPVRFLMGYPLEFNKITGGDGVLNHAFDAFKPQASVPSERQTGCLIAQEAGEVTGYALAGLSGQGKFFVEPGQAVYVGQIIGENTKQNFQELPVNCTKRNEQLGGLRSNVNDAKNKRKMDWHAQEMTLDDYIAFAHPSELIVVTPTSVRMRKPGFAGKCTMRSK